MNELVQFVLRHGYAVLFFFVLVEQIGLPVPAVPALLAAGALAGANRVSLPAAILAAVSACLVSDLIWYELGRKRGQSMLSLLCRISLEPDSCVRRTEDVFARHGVRALLVAKFVPGLNTAAPPLAGMFRMRLARFLLWDAAGALIWAGTFCGAGYVFSAQLERVARLVGRLGAWLVVLLGSALAGYIAWKYIQRRRFLRQLRIARVPPEELMEKLTAREEVVVVDLRHSLEFDTDNVMIPGSLHLLPDELDHRHHEIPRDRDVILYCT
jgi:membrane protein DedA with SNARE-associated domain